MKKFILAFSIITTSFVAVAQTNTSNTQWGGGVRVGLLVGDYEDFYSFVLGAELQAEHRLSSNVTGTFTTGYFHHIGKETGNIQIDGVGMIPILFGVRVYPSPTFFIGGRIGAGILTEGSEKTAFNYEPQIGYNGRRMQLALGYNARPNNGATLSHIGLSAIVKFN